MRSELEHNWQSPPTKRRRLGGKLSIRTPKPDAPANDRQLKEWADD